MKKIIFTFLVLLLFQNTIAQNESDKIELTDLLKIKTVGNINLSPDGSKLAFTVKSIETDEKSVLDYKFKTQIYMASTTGEGTPIQLTNSKEGASNPVWSPEGKQLVFTRTVDEKSQLFLLSLSGGEAKQLTKFKYGASNPKWSPDGNKLLFSAAISLSEMMKDSTLNPNYSVPTWSLEKPGFDKNEHLIPNKSKGNPDGSMAEIRAYLNQNAIDKKAIVLDKLNFQNESNISSDMNFNHYFEINVTKESSPAMITKGFYNFSSADYTPDGKQIIFSGDVDTSENQDRSLESEIFISDTDGSNFKMILGEKGKQYTNAKISPKGKWIAFLVGKVSYVSIPTLEVMPFNGTSKDIISIPYDRNKNNFVWSQNEAYLYFTSQANGGTIINRLDIKTKKITPLTKTDSGISSFDIVNSVLAYSKSQVSNPSELYLANAEAKNEKKISNYNDWVLSKKLSFPEKKSFVNDLGLTVEYWVMKPTNFKEGTKYPVLLEMHGGPAAMWGPGEESMWHEFQYFCSKGYGIVYANPRGSGGYGLDFLQGNINDWGKGPASDVLTALDKTVDLSWADSSKLMITGGSYAGYLTAWIISHDKRFKVACAQRGVYDLTTFFGEGNAWRLVPNYFGGYPWEPKVKETLTRESPFTYVENITTPFIIFHGANDRRTGFVQGEMMYRSLKVLGRPVEYVVHPGATHEITRAGDNRQRMDQMLRTYEFFERWISEK
ncbi:S9 family peptidase [Flavobacterium sp.]|jgi:dipeptidyl aminopeptidase/acylaminoacyl peptidase|uniref:S9 family peptidase n=1 Tax=Flavobacterium sp. TaxID=239 RepID=UPI0037C11FF7